MYVMSFRITEYASYPHKNLQPQSQSVLNFSSQATQGVLVGGNKEISPPLLMVFSIPQYNPITHV
jgi:hypothetical protein